MVDERTRVLRDLMLRLQEAGIRPDSAFSATYLPGEGWTFSSEDHEAGSSSSSSAGGAHVPSTTSVRPQSR